MSAQLTVGIYFSLDRHDYGSSGNQSVEQDLEIRHNVGLCISYSSSVDLSSASEDEGKQGSFNSDYSFLDEIGVVTGAPLQQGHSFSRSQTESSTSRSLALRYGRWVTTASASVDSAASLPSSPFGDSDESEDRE